MPYKDYEAAKIKSREYHRREDIKEKEAAKRKTAEFRNKKRAYDHAYAVANPKKYLLKSAKTRAKKNNTEFSITEKDFEIPEKCPIYGMNLSMVNGHTMSGASLDRVDNSKGYIPGNVRVISRQANLDKRHLDIALLERFIAYIKGEI